MPGLGALANGLAPASDAPVPSKADVLRSMGESPPPPKNKANNSSFSYTNPSDQEAAGRRQQVREESRLPLYGPPKVSFFKKLLCCAFKGDASDSGGSKEEKGKGRLDEMSEEDYAPHPVGLTQEKVRDSAPLARKPTPPPPSSIPAGPSKSTPPKVSNTTTSWNTASSYSNSVTITGVSGGTARSGPLLPQYLQSWGSGGHYYGGGGGGGEGGGDGGGGDGGGDGGDGGGCILGSCVVDMADGTTKRVVELVKGDLVAATSFHDVSKGLSTAEISCIISFKLLTGKKNMIRVPHSSLVISPNHPISVPIVTSSLTDSEETAPRNHWIYPSTLANPLTIPCDHVYNIILKPSDPAEAVTITVGGMQIATLGQHPNHSFSGDYEKVTGELRRIDAKGFERGFVELGGMRRTQYGISCGFLSVEEVGYGTGTKTEQQGGHLVAATA